MRAFFGTCLLCIAVLGAVFGPMAYIWFVYTEEEDSCTAKGGYMTRAHTKAPWYCKLPSK